MRDPPVPLDDSTVQLGAYALNEVVLGDRRITADGEIPSRSAARLASDQDHATSHLVDAEVLPLSLRDRLRGMLDATTAGGVVHAGLPGRGEASGGRLPDGRKGGGQRQAVRS